MNLEFTEVTYDGDLEDASADELRSAVAEFEDAQEQNAAEFEAAKEQIDEIEGVDTEEFEQAREDLIEGIEDSESFEESPLVDESDLEEATFSRLREFAAYFAEQDAEEEADEGDADFDDMGQEAPEDETEVGDEFAHLVDDISGVNVGDN